MKRPGSLLNDLRTLNLRFVVRGKSDSNYTSHQDILITNYFIYIESRVINNLSISNLDLESKKKPIWVKVFGMDLVKFVEDFK